MSDPIPERSLISTLEHSLRETRNAQRRFITRLREVEAESQRLRQEIDAMENSAAQTEAAINSLLVTIRSDNPPRITGINNYGIDANYEIPADVNRMRHSNDTMLEDIRGGQTGNLNRNDSYNRNNGDDRYSDSGYRPTKLPFAENNRTVPRVGQNIEPISQRFMDRTITQACTLLLRESNHALHVNELYNFLVAGGFGFKGNNPTISIAVSLNRNRRFRKVAPGTFDLVMRDASQAAS